MSFVVDYSSKVSRLPGKNGALEILYDDLPAQCFTIKKTATVLPTIELNGRFLYTWAGEFLITIVKPAFMFILSILFNDVEVKPQSPTSEIEQFFAAVKNSNLDAAERSAKAMAALDEEILKQHLNTEEKAKAFWINTYNTYVQYLLKKNPKLFEDRESFFSDDLITIAGQEISLDLIEHGIIRRSRNKYSFGYLGKLIKGDYELKFRLEALDYRIHFALNCGAQSCPPVALYDARTIDVQLEKITALYLKKNTRLDKAENEVYVPRLCSWFRADFGGEDGIVEMLQKHGIIHAGQEPDVKFLDYNWDLKLGNYIQL